MEYVRSTINGMAYIATPHNRKSPVCVPISNDEAKAILGGKMKFAPPNAAPAFVAPVPPAASKVDEATGAAVPPVVDPLPPFVPPLSVETATEETVKAMDETTARAFAHENLGLKFPEGMKVDTILRHVWEKTLLMQARNATNKVGGNNTVSNA